MLLGRLTNAKGTAETGGTTEFIIEVAFKKHPIMAGKERLTLPKYVPDTGDKRFLIFCDASGGKLDPYRGIQEADNGKLTAYFRGLLFMHGRPLTERLCYVFDHLESSDPEVARDAFHELSRAGYQRFRAMAKTLPADKIAGWLKNPNTPSERYGLYGLLLGECGTARHEPALCLLLKELKKTQAASLDGVLAGYVILQPRDGWEYLQEMLADPQADFLHRFQAVRTIRFLWEERPDVISKADLTAALVAVLRSADVADFAIEDLRKWQRWGLCDRILALYGKEGYNAPIIRRAILCYALCCPNPRALAFVQKQRALDPDLVADIEEIVRLESEALSAAPK